MEKSAILNELKSIFKDTLENDDINLDYTTVAADVEEWDSLNHIQLIVAIEKHFKIRFTSKEIQSWANVGDIVDSIQTKM